MASIGWRNHGNSALLDTQIHQAHGHRIVPASRERAGLVVGLKPRRPQASGIRSLRALNRQVRDTCRALKTALSLGQRSARRRFTPDRNSAQILALPRVQPHLIRTDQAGRPEAIKLHLINRATRQRILTRDRLHGLRQGESHRRTQRSRHTLKHCGHSIVPARAN